MYFNINTYIFKEYALQPIMYFFFHFVNHKSYNMQIRKYSCFRQAIFDLCLKQDLHCKLFFKRLQNNLKLEAPNLKYA